MRKLTGPSRITVQKIDARGLETLASSGRKLRDKVGDCRRHDGRQVERSRMREEEESESEPWALASRKGERRW
jgi:hypothetical protein